MNGYFLNMNNIDITTPDISGTYFHYLQTIKIILNKYFYTNNIMMENLRSQIIMVLKTDIIDISRSVNGRLSMNIKISKSLKKSIKKDCKKKFGSDNDMYTAYFYQVLEEPMKNFLTLLLSNPENFKKAVISEFSGNTNSVIENYEKIYNEFLLLIQSGKISNELLHITSLLERDNYIIIEFL